MASDSVVHLVYIHGFQGNDTTFQSFPTDLHRYLSSRLQSRFKVQTSLYPTYKSAKPISSATRNFLRWLATQPPADFILLCHSMGGLLGAEAVTDKVTPNPKPYRIIGLVAFDTPYLGMHPHIVISGIASLLPKGTGKHLEGGEKKPTNKELNDETKVKVVNARVTADDWASKENLEVPAQLSQLSLASPSPSRSPSPSPPRSHSPSNLPTSHILEHTISFLSRHGNESFARWLRKHADEPFTASVRWIVEHYQFGVCMFDPAGLKERYLNLVAWNGMWINYWTETTPKKAKHRISHGDSAKKEQAINEYVTLLGKDIPVSVDSLLLSTDTNDTTAPKSRAGSTETDPTQQSESTIAKLEKPEKSHDKCFIRRDKHGRHFVVRPVGLGKGLGGVERWEKVQIAGVEDEVAAHCGLFIPEQNLDYEGLVERVGKRVMVWCENL